MPNGRLASPPRVAGPQISAQCPAAPYGANSAAPGSGRTVALTFDDGPGASTRGGWAGARSLGGDLASEPAPVASSPGNVDVFWKGTDGGLWHVYNSAGRGWSAPVSLGMGQLGSGPAATGQLGGAIDVFWRGSADTHLWHAYYRTGHGWAGAQNLGGDLYPIP
jgi:hypothetical protein